MNQREKDRLGAVILVMVAIGICYGSFKLSLGGFRTPGPGFFSFLAGLILGLLSLFCFFMSFRSQPGDERKPFWPHPKRTFKMSYIFIALIVYVFGMHYIGFGLATFLFLGFLLRGIEPQRWSVVIAVSIMGVAVTYGVFQFWLGMQLPTGLLGF